MPLEQQTGFDDDPALLVTDVLGDLVRPVSFAPVGTGPVVVTGTYVSDPPFFGGGDVGRLAVSGVVNSLATDGAEPQTVALALTVEAGLPRLLLRRLAESVRDTTREAGVTVAAVHGRVVRAGEADQVYVTATAIGSPRPHRRTARARGCSRATASWSAGRSAITRPICCRCAPGWASNTM